MPLIDPKATPLPKKDPVERPDYTESQLAAVRAVARGTATDDQQRVAMKYIVEVVCGTYDIAYRASERDTLVALGKQLAGQHLVWLAQKAEGRKPSTEGEQA